MGAEELALLAEMGINRTR